MTGELSITRGSVAGRAVVDNELIHIEDLTLKATEFRDVQVALDREGVRTILVAPLEREGRAIGVILIRRTEVRPFSEKQIALLKTFADQAVIAIENVRLFKELQERNAELHEALEQQTATGEVLRVIASSPTDLQPVLDTLIANAVKLSGATKGHVRQLDGEFYRVVAHYGESPERISLLRANPLPTSPDTPTGRALAEHRPVHVLDVQSETGPQASLARQTGARTLLATPLLREGTPIGGITIWRDVVEPFTERQIDLVRTFADQAVIAIENVRLFKELEQRNDDLTEALEQQTATSAILGVIASSPTDIQPVLEAIAESATRLCDATDAHISHVDGDTLRLNAHTSDASLQREVPITRNHIAGQAILDRRTIHIHDLAAEPEDKYGAPRWRTLGFRTVLVAPLLREATALGTITIRRKEVRPFTDKQIALLETFANQAVIAIENVRLFKEIQERNAELREALEHQTATSEVLGIISRSPTDVQPVLDAIVESAARVCGIDDVVLRLQEGATLTPRAHFGPIPIGRIEISSDVACVSLDARAWLAPRSRRPSAERFPNAGLHDRLAYFLGRAPSSAGELIGTLNARRTEVRPFTPAQIKLLETFADQAVIAIENVRLFNELKESLEQQTATSEILGVIASSPTDIQPVLDIVAKTAAKLCDAGDAAIWRTDGQEYWLVASHGPIPVPNPEVRRPMIRSFPSGRAMIDKETVHIHDMMTPESSGEFFDSFRTGEIRTILTTPLLREGLAIGAIHVRRPEVRPFTDKQIALLKTFAAKPSSPSRMSGSSRNCRSVTPNCARRWSIRRPPPRCSASSAARPRMCSRCLTRLWQAPCGFVGLMM